MFIQKARAASRTLIQLGKRSLGGAQFSRAGKHELFISPCSGSVCDLDFKLCLALFVALDHVPIHSSFLTVLCYRRENECWVLFHSKQSWRVKNYSYAYLAPKMNFSYKTTLRQKRGAVQRGTLLNNLPHQRGLTRPSQWWGREEHSLPSASPVTIVSGNTTVWGPCQGLSGDPGWSLSPSPWKRWRDQPPA